MLVGESQASTAETLSAIIVLYALQEHDSFEQHKGWCKIPQGNLLWLCYNISYTTAIKIRLQNKNCFKTLL